MRFYWVDELAEVDQNEDGPVIGYVYKVMAQLDSGKRSVYHVIFGEKEAEAFVAKCKALHEEGVDVLTEQADDWIETAPCYGSAHHQAVGDVFLLDKEELYHRGHQG